jgi:tetratricopeptide (TPR) repeat protein
LRRLSDLEMARGDLQAALAARARAGDELEPITAIRTKMGARHFEEALADLDVLLAADRDDGLALALRAAVLADLGRFEEAAATSQRVIDRFPDETHARIVQAGFRRALGDTDGVVAALRACVAADPTCAEAWLQLADIKSHRLSASDLLVLEQAASAVEPGPGDRARLLFALAKARDDAGDAEGAFAGWTEANAIERDRRGYRPETNTALVRRCEAVFTADYFATRAGWGAKSDEPIFVLGMPRSGSSLVEQILASHPAIEGAGELPDLITVAATVAAYPEGVGALDRPACGRLGEDYLGRTKGKRLLGRARFVDKRPQNVWHLGFLRTVLPNARIVDVRRHPLDVGVSIFRQHFGAGFNWAFDLEHIGRAYADYVDLAAHFDAVQPGAVHRVIYEDLAADTEGEVRRLLAFLGLPFDPACLRFFETRRAVDTPSAEQVRHPIHDRSIGAWRRYEPRLGPLKAALGPALEGWRG